jgi:hypothetical protein
MFNIPDHKGNLNQNYMKIPLDSWPQQRCGEKGILIHCWCECKLVQPLCKTVWTLLTKLKIKLPYDPAILLGIYPNECKSSYN